MCQSQICSKAMSSSDTFWWSSWHKKVCDSACRILKQFNPKTTTFFSAKSKHNSVMHGALKSFTCTLHVYIYIDRVKTCKNSQAFQQTLLQQTLRPWSWFSNSTTWWAGGQGGWGGMLSLWYIIYLCYIYIYIMIYCAIYIYIKHTYIYIDRCDIYIYTYI